MVRVSPAAFSTVSGELSELMFGRRDFVRHQNGARALRGFIVLPEGPVTRLPGTRFMGYTHLNRPARLTAFVFSDEDAILLEWTDALLRFWRQGAEVLQSGSPYSIATPYPADALKNLRSLQSADRVYLVDGARRPRRLSRLALTNWTLDNTPFTGGPFAPRNLDQAIEVLVSAETGAVTLTASAALFAAHHVGTLFQIFEIDTSDTPYWEADVDAAIGDRYYSNARVYQIVGFDDQNGRTGAALPAVAGMTIATDNEVTWGWVSAGNPLSAPAWQANGLVAIGERRHHPSEDITMEVTGFVVTPRKRKTGTNPPIHAEGRWLAGPAGPVWEALHDGNGIVRITAVASATSASGTVEKRIPEGLLTRPSYRWAEQAWSDARGWPRAIGGYEQRHLYGGTASEPRNLWAGVMGGTTDMTSGRNDDDGFSYILADLPREVGQILSITASGDVLFIGTTADEQVGRSTDMDRAFGRETAKFKAQSAEGAAPLSPVVVESSPVFIDKTGLRLIIMSIDPSTGQLRPEVLTTIARHILAPGALRMVWQRHPVPILWIVLADGDLAALTFIPSQQVIGFSRHKLGGTVEDAEVLPSDDGKSEDLWLVVRRQLQGQTRRCVERMEKPFIDLDGTPRALADAWHQMCALRWQGAASTTIGGLAHLEGETVTAWTERGAVTGLVVSGGQIVLPDPVTSAIVGLDVTALQYFDSLDIATGQPDGGDDGRLRTHRVGAIRLHRSAGGTLELRGVEHGIETSVAPPVPLQDPDPFEVPVLRDGIVESPGHKGWRHQLWYRIRPEPGAPLTVAVRTPTVMITDD
jgi:hypothetical protein